MDNLFNRIYRWICIILFAIELISLLLVFTMNIWLPILRVNVPWIIALVVVFVYLACCISLIPIQLVLGIVVLFCEKDRKNRIYHLLFMIGTVVSWLGFWYVMIFFVI